MAGTRMADLLPKFFFLLVLINHSQAMEDSGDNRPYHPGQLMQQHLGSLYQARSSRVEHLQGRQGDLTGVSAQCVQELTVVAAANRAPANYSWVLEYNNADARGTFPPKGALLGKLDAQGSYDQCVKIWPTWKKVMLEDAMTGGLQYVGLHNFTMQYCKARYRTQDYRLSFAEGWCLPRSCDRYDVIAMMRNKNETGFPLHEAYCGTKPPLKTNAAGIAAITVCCIFGALILLATIYDGVTQWLEEHKSKVASEEMQLPLSDSGKPHPDGVLQGHTNLAMEHESTSNGVVRRSVGKAGEPAESNQVPVAVEAVRPKEADKPNVAVCLLLSFSLYRTVPAVVQSGGRRSTFGSMNGLRVIAMMWIVLGHSVTLDTTNSFNPYIANLVDVGTAQRDLSYQIIRHMNLGVEVFFYLSGALVTLSFLKTLDRNKNIGVLGWVQEMALYVFHRYWRLTPVIAALMLIVTPLWQYFGHGPNFPEAYPLVDACKKLWWVNLLYIQNFYRGDTLAGCLSWSWYLANDFQYYLIVPVFAVVLYKKPIIGGVFIFLGWGGSIAARAVLIPRDGIDSYWEVYVKPWTRFGPYAQGIMMGYLIYRTKGKIRMHWALVVLGWLVAVALGLLILFVQTHNYTWTKLQKDAYNVVWRDGFTLALSWVVFACVHGYGGLINSFLSWNFFTKLSKLTYCGYLIHPVIHYIAITSQQQLLYFRGLDMATLYIGNLILTFLCSLGFTLVFEVPFLALEKVMIPRKK